MQQNPTACLIIIGNEILSGRTQDINLAWLSKALNAEGITMVRSHIITDEESEIINTVNEARARYDYVFTTGGIGPTHDDITTACVAKALDVAVERNADATRRLEAHYDADMLNEARLKMADIPVGAALIDNPVSAAPGFRLKNVFVMAGVPKIMHAMFDHIKTMLKGGAPTRSRHITAWAREGDVAADLSEVQATYPDVEIGCYPLIRNGKMGCSLVARSIDTAKLDAVMQACEALMLRHASEIIEKSE